MDITHEIRLMNFIEQNQGRPFTWGECDCNTFVLDVVDAVFDIALAAKVKGKYKNELGAIRFRQRCEWGSFIELLKEAGFVGGKKGFEQVGDILIVADPGKWEMAHIYLGNKTVTAFPDEGVLQFPTAMLKDKPYSVWRYSPCRPQ
jgi:hypothetical protein